MSCTFIKTLDKHAKRLSKTKVESRGSAFIHKSRKPFRYDHLNDWLQNTMDVKLDLSNYTAHTLRQQEFTDMASQGGP